MYKLYIICLKLAVSIYPEEKDLNVLFEKAEQIASRLYQIDPSFTEDNGVLPDIFWKL